MTMIAYMPKHHPKPMDSASGSIAEIAPPAKRHLTILEAACAVADLFILRSVKRVEVI